MKKLLFFATTIATLGVVPAFAQLGGQGPNFGGPMNKLYGANQTFSAAMEIQTSANGSDITIPGKTSFDSGKSRFEMNMSDMKGSQMPPNAVEQMKAMGMDSMISISRPDLKLTYIIYPGLKSYAAMPPRDPSTSTNPDDYKAETTALGTETVDGHDCTKSKVTVTDKDGKKTEFTVCNASDLKNFPVKIVTGDPAHPVTILFKNVSLAKPSAGLFEAPAGFTKYDDARTMMQTEMMKHMPQPQH